MQKILFVDDDLDFLQQNKIRFSGAGYMVETAENQTSAKEKFSLLNPDLVVIDLMMEEMDMGIVLAHHFKKQNPQLPVIMVTGVTKETGFIFDSAKPEDRNWLKADKILAKPIRYEQLLREVEIMLKR